MLTLFFFSTVLTVGSLKSCFFRNYLQTNIRIKNGDSYEQDLSGFGGCNNPQQSSYKELDSAKKFFIGSMLFSSVFLRKAQEARAIGSLYELRNQSMVIQDVSLKVINTYRESLLYTRSLQDTIKVIRNKNNRDINTTGTHSYPYQIMLLAHQYKQGANLKLSVQCLRLVLIHIKALHPSNQVLVHTSKMVDMRPLR